MPETAMPRLPVQTTDVEYLRHGDVPLLATIYQPQGEGPFPALVDVHGGQWSGGSRSTDAPMDLPLAESGVVVMAIDFRLAPAHPYPAQLQDMNYAVRWLKAHAGDYQVDPACIGGLRASSGGHGIVLTAMRPADPRYAAIPLPEAPAVDASLRFVISCWGIVDPLARYQFALQDPAAGEGRGGPEGLQRSTFGYFGSEDTLREGNPQLILGRGEQVQLPPLLVIQGDQDKNIPYTIPQKFAASWVAAGGKARFELYPGEAHAFANRPGPSTDRALAAIRSFIADQTG